MSAVLYAVDQHANIHQIAEHSRNNILIRIQSLCRHSKGVSTQEGQNNKLPQWAMLKFTTAFEQTDVAKLNDLAWVGAWWIMLADAAFISVITSQSCRGDPDASPVLAGTPIPAQPLDHLSYCWDLCHTRVPSLSATNADMAHIPYS